LGKVNSYVPIRGKTYSLFGYSDNTAEFYQASENLVSECLLKEPDKQELLRTIRAFSNKRRTLNRIAGRPANGSLISFLLDRCDSVFSAFTQDVENHLKDLSIKSLWDRRLGTTRKQYYLHMLEITLVNQMNKQTFLQCDNRIALLPYCLGDFSVDCKSSQDEFDYRCKHCSQNCYQNQVSRILKNHHIEPYIWMSADFKRYCRELMKNGKTLGVLGIACVPELAWGIHECAKYNIPVVGIPLDANRCIRWWGEFHPNSVNIEQLEKLVTVLS
jgi:hypothetical protein